MALLRNSCNDFTVSLNEVIENGADGPINASPRPIIAPVLSVLARIAEYASMLNIPFSLTSREVIACDSLFTNLMPCAIPLIAFFIKCHNASILDSLNILSVSSLF